MKKESNIFLQLFEKEVISIRNKKVKDQHKNKFYNNCKIYHKTNFRSNNK